MSVDEPWGYAGDWTPEQIDKWKRDYAADQPVLLPHYEHEEGECGHCDLLRQWMREVHDVEAASTQARREQ